MPDLKISDLTAATAIGSSEFEIVQGGVNKRAANTLLYTPPTNDGAALGSTTLMWSDLFLASGGVVNFNNGNYTLTHSAGVLTANGALSIGTGNALTAGTIELGAATDTTLSRGAAGFIAVEGNHVPSPASQASGDLLYRGATEWERLAKGTAAQVLTMNAGATAPEWATPAGGGGITEVVVQVITSTGTYTPTAGMAYCIAEVVGGGAGGQSVTNDTDDGAGGGGAGGYARKLITAATIGASQSVTIGAGGAANSAGGTTSLGAIMSATGGAAGDNNDLPGTLGGLGTGGDVNARGMRGMLGSDSSSFGAGDGGSSPFGAGGTGSSAGANGAAATGYGSGGAGAYTTNTTDRVGGAGSAGVVVITEFIA